MLFSTDSLFFFQIGNLYVPDRHLILPYNVNPIFPGFVSSNDAKPKLPNCTEVPAEVEALL